jgi:hypothetical protein
MMRSILAVFTGIVVLTLLTFAIEAATTPILMNAFPNALATEEAMQRNVPMKLFILVYSALCMIAAGFTTAWIASRNELRLAIIMAGVQVALTAWAMSAFYDHAPLWAWLCGMVLMVPAAWIGAKLRLKRRAGQQHAVRT